MSNIAYNYQKCYWNASGEFECTGTKDELPQPSAPNNNGNYAKVPLSQKTTDRSVIEPYVGAEQPDQPPQRSCGQQLRQPQPQRKGPFNDHASNETTGLREKRAISSFGQRNNSLCPLNREMEISVYLPDRDERYPWEGGEDSQRKSSTSPPTLQPQPQPQLPQPPQLPPHSRPPIPPQQPSPQPLLPPQLPPLLESRVRPGEISLETGMGGSPSWNSSLKYKVIGRNSRYYFQLPSNVYNDLVNEFGSPSLLNQNRGGLAIWQKSRLKNTRFHTIQRIDLLDEQIYSQFPHPHIGFLYTYVKIEIPEDKVSQILGLSNNLMYDPAKKTLVVRGLSLNYNIAIIAIICLYVNGEITWYNITEGDILRKSTTYQQLINRRSQNRNLGILNKYLSLGSGSSSNQKPQEPVSPFFGWLFS
jgi:hypothetical protein